MEFRFTGMIVSIGDLQTIQTSGGNPLIKREIQLQTVEEYPNSIVVELTGEKASGFAGAVGQMADAYLNFRARQSAGGRAFNSIRAWRIDLQLPAIPTTPF